MAFMDSITRVASSAGNIIIVTVVWILIAALTIGIVYLVLKRKQYQHYTALIFKRKKDKEGNETLVYVGRDKAAIIKDKKLMIPYSAILPFLNLFISQLQLIQHL